MWNLASEVAFVVCKLQQLLDCIVLVSCLTDGRMCRRPNNKLVTAVNRNLCAAAFLKRNSNLLCAVELRLASRLDTSGLTVSIFP